MLLTLGHPQGVHGEQTMFKIKHFAQLKWHLVQILSNCNFVELYLLLQISHMCSYVG
jgi:hypothetical protein